MPSLMEKYSETNLLNSVATYVAGQLLAAGYLVFWHARDAVQTANGWYVHYSTMQSTYLADSTFAATYNAAKGMVTLVDALPAVPRFVVRLTSDASIGPADVVPVPAMAIELGAAIPLIAVELGTHTKWRTRHLLVDCFVRSREEQALFKDALNIWLDENTMLDIANHDAGDLSSVGPVEVLDVTVASTKIVDRAEATTYQVLLNARLEYVA